MAEKEVALVSAEGVFLRVDTVDAAAALRAGQVAVLPPDPDAPKGAWVYRNAEWLRRCARVDPNGVYLGMVEVAPEDLTAQHLPAVAECDLTAGHARWVAELDNPYGGRFDPLPPALRPKENGAPTDHQMLDALLGALVAQGIGLPLEATRWRAWYATTVDKQTSGRG